MSSVPVYHLSPTGRAAIDAESARIRQELAARRAERESRLQPRQGLDGIEASTANFLAVAEAVPPQAEDSPDRP